MNQLARAAAVTLMGPWPPPSGGVATHVRSLRGFLDRAGYRTQVLGETNGNDREIHTLDPRRRAIFRLLAQLVSVPEPGSILHCHGSLTSYPSSASLTMLGAVVRARGLRWVETIHDQTLIRRYETWPRRRRRALSAGLSRTHHVMVVGPSLHEFIRSLGVPVARLSETTPLIDSDLDVGEVPDRLRSFVSRHSPLITAAGAPTADYDFVTFVVAFRELQRRQPDAGMILAASGFATDSDYGRSIASAVRGGSGIEMATDLPYSQFLRLVAESDAVLRGPREESFGMVRAEAALLGTPVIGTATGASAFTVPYQFADPETLVTALRQVVEHGQYPDPAAARAYFRQVAEVTRQGVIDAYGSAIAS